MDKINSFARRLLGVVGLCGHGGSLFMGSFLEKDGKESNVYSCGKCGRVYKSGKRRVVDMVMEGHKFDMDGNLIFLVRSKGVSGYSSTYRSAFIELLKSGKVSFGRDDLSGLLAAVELGMKSVLQQNWKLSTKNELVRSISHGKDGVIGELKVRVSELEAIVATFTSEV